MSDETGFDIEAARRTYRARLAARRAADRDRRDKARQEADSIIAMIVERYEPKRVIQWGSVLGPDDRFTEMSDIDIAVEGVHDPAEWSRLERDVLDASTFPVDLLRVETVLPEHLSVILRRGRVVYERS